MSEVINIKELNERIERESVFVDTLRTEMGKVDRGADPSGRHAADRAAVERTHPPGRRAGTGQDAGHHARWQRPSDADSRRIQFTPDLLPADLIGTLIYSQKSEEFVVKQRPRLRQLRAGGRDQPLPAKVQSALLEAMQERQVTIGDRHLQAAAAVPGAGHAEPPRAGGYLPAARSAGRPIHAQSQDLLPQEAGGARHRAR